VTSIAEAESRDEASCLDGIFGEVGCLEGLLPQTWLGERYHSVASRHNPVTLDGGKRNAGKPVLAERTVAVGAGGCGCRPEVLV